MKSLRHVPPGNTRRILMVVGCQRSGTTMLTRMLERDPRSSVYRERSRLSDLDGTRGLRLNPLDQVRRVLDSDSSPLIVMKPLVESQRTPELLDSLGASRAIWIYRHHASVSYSMVNRWGPEHVRSQLLPIVGRVSDDWRFEACGDDVVRLIERHFADDMPPHDAGALFWYARNRLVPDLRLGQRGDVLLVRYESLVGEPSNEIERIYRFLEMDVPDGRMAREVHRGAMNRASRVSIEPSIAALCDELEYELDRISDS